MKSTRKNAVQGRAQRFSDKARFSLSDDEGRGKEDVVAVDAVDAALGRIREHVLVEGGLADALGDVALSGKGLARGFVSYEFNTKEQAEATNLAYVRMRFQC